MSMIGIPTSLFHYLPLKTRKFVMDGWGFFFILTEDGRDEKKKKKLMEDNNVRFGMGKDS